MTIYVDVVRVNEMLDGEVDNEVALMEGIMRTFFRFEKGWKVEKGDFYVGI